MTSQKTGAPIPGVAVVVTSPSGTYTAKTDAKGFFSLIGLPTDTYSVSFKLAGRQTTVVNGVTVNAQQTTTVTQVLNDEITIGRVVSRSQNGAYQPSQPQDTYTVNPQQIDTILGKAKATSETNLLVALPGASLDSSGYPVLRGGRENEEGFQFEGIDYTDAFTSQFVNSLAINGVGSFQLTPGTGDASTGNAGTGTININLLRGTRPAFGTLDLEARGPAYSHQFSGDYGFATPDGKFSNYISFVGQRTGAQVGYRGSGIVQDGSVIPQNYSTSNDLVDNLIFKFGHDNNQQLQFVYQNQQNNFFLQGAPGTIENFASGEALTLYEFSGISGLSKSVVGSLIGFETNQTSQNQSLASINKSAYTYYQPNETFKLQYSNNLDASTFLTAKAYRVGSVVTFDSAYQPGSYYFYDYDALQGGERSGVQIDLTKQLGSHNLVAVGVKAEYLHPVFTEPSATGGFGNLLFSPGGEVYDFVSVANGGTGYLTGNNANGPGGTGVNYFPNGVPRVPVYNETTQLDRQDLSYYITDAITVSDRLKVNLGLRVDSTNINLPKIGSGAYLPASGAGYSDGNYLPISTGYLADGVTPDPSKDKYAPISSAVQHPSIVEPRAAFSYQITKADAIRASYGRGAQLASLAFLDLSVPRSTYNAFVGIPSTGNYCGPTGDRACRDYADQLYWENQNVAGIPIQPVKPETFNNYDASYSHDFGHGISTKITPFYRRNYDAFALVQSQKLVNGQVVLDANGAPLLNPAVTTNLGTSRTSGIEFYATKESAYGLSGQLSLTYINEFSNVIPTSGSEDFFPGIPPASLALGNQYRVGFVSPFNAALAFAYRTRSGIKINPIITANRGYPYGNGNITATTINGQYVNVVQTNVTNQLGGTTLATNYVDPQNPGTQYKPNIAATRGTPTGASAGEYLSAPRASTAIDIEFSPPHSRSTFGVLVSNVFSNIYTQPLLNSRYQPVANGVSGPKTGTSSLTQLFGPSYGYVNYSTQRFGYDPYVFNPTGTPTTYRAYYQLSF